MSRTIKINNQVYELLDEDYTFNFECKYQVCNKCCSVRIYLSPAEIFRICRNQNMSTTEFHQEYTKFVLNKELQIPICSLKTNPVCKFLQKDRTCKIYKDRPVTCKMYPIGFLYADGKLNFYHDKVCIGHTSNQKHTIKSWLEHENVSALIPFEEKWIDFLYSKEVAEKRQNIKDFAELFAYLFYDFDNPQIQGVFKENNIDTNNFEELIEFAMKFLLK